MCVLLECAFLCCSICNSRLRNSHLLPLRSSQPLFLCWCLLGWDTLRNDILWLCVRCDSIVRNRFLVTCTKVRSMVSPSAYSGEHLSCVSSSFCMPPKALSIVVDNRPRDLSPTVYFNPLFSSMLPSTFVTFSDTHTSPPVLGFFQPQSQWTFAIHYVVLVLVTCLLLAMLFSYPLWVRSSHACGWQCSFHQL